MNAAIIAFDPLVVLKAQWDALHAECGRIGDYYPKEADAISMRMIKVEDLMAALVPRSPAGATAQLWLLRMWGDAFEWNEPHEQLADKLLAGLERIGEAQLNR